MSNNPADPISQLAQWLLESRYTTVFSGAGASTESGAIHDISYMGAIPCSA